MSAPKVIGRLISDEYPSRISETLETAAEMDATTIEELTRKARAVAELFYLNNPNSFTGTHAAGIEKKRRMYSSAILGNAFTHSPEDNPQEKIEFTVTINRHHTGEMGLQLSGSSNGQNYGYDMWSSAVKNEISESEHSISINNVMEGKFDESDTAKFDLANEWLTSAGKAALSPVSQSATPTHVSQALR